MYICDLPDMYALRLVALGFSVHIRQIPHAHVTTIIRLTRECFYVYMYGCNYPAEIVFA